MTTVNLQIVATADDGRRYTGTGGFSTTDTQATIGYSTNAAYLHMHAFWRWVGASISGTIDAAYAEVYVHSAGAGTAQSKVYGVDEDNPAAPTSAAEFDADPLTAAAIDWDGAWSIGVWEESPSLTTIFQELVDTYTISNDAIMLQCKNDAGAVNQNMGKWADYGNFGATYSPKLHIDYTAAGVTTRRYGLTVLGVG